MSKREQILGAAIEFAYIHGLAQSNANQIAKVMSIRPSLVYYYFKSEQGLMEQMLAHIVMSNNSIVNAAFAQLKRPTGSEQVETYLKYNLLWGQQNPAHLAVLCGGITLSKSNPVIANLVAQALQAGEDKLYSFIAAGIAEKQMSCAYELRLAVKILHQNLIGSLVHYLGTLAGPTPESSIDIYLQQLLVLFSSLFPKL